MDWTKTRVLLVHGDIHVRRWAHDIFHQNKVASVQSTPSLATGLDLLKRFPADVAIVQLSRPEMTGAEFARRIRNDKRSPNPGLPIVLIVDTPNAPLLREACAAGIEGVVARPTTPETFLKRVASAVAEPRRFVASDAYFGPCRRRAPVADFPGPERRRALPAPIRAEALPAPSAPAAAAKSAIVAPKPAAAASAKPAPAGPAAAQVIEPVAGKAPRHDAKAWAEAIAPIEEASPVAVEAGLDLAAVLAAHAAWLHSQGGEGTKAGLAGADLHGQTLSGALLTSANLREADLSDADCRNAVFASADLRRADLSSADLTGANLAVASLRGANFKRARLAQASLRGADMAGACLTGADTTGADFAGAILLGADLGDADLSAAIGLVQSQIDRARTNASTRLPAPLRRPAAES